MIILGLQSAYGAMTAEVDQAVAEIAAQNAAYQEQYRRQQQEMLAELQVDRLGGVNPPRTSPPVTQAVVAPPVTASTDPVARQPPVQLPPVTSLLGTEATDTVTPPMQTALGPVPAATTEPVMQVATPVVDRTKSRKRRVSNTSAPGDVQMQSDEDSGEIYHKHMSCHES